MNKKHISVKHDHCTGSPNADLYDKVTHTIDDTTLSVKFPKDKRTSMQTVDEKLAKPVPLIDVSCYDKWGNKCKKGCPKVNVIHNQAPPPKKPEEEMLLLRTMRHITPMDEMKHILEVEFKLPRNYIPLRETGPPPHP